MTAVPLGRPGSRPFTPALSFCASLAPCAAFAATLALRCPALLLRPRLWAEEGEIYWERMRHLRIRDGLGLVVRGNYQLLTDAIVDGAKLVPSRDIAWVTTYSALAVSLLCCWMLGDWVRARGLPVWVGAAAAAMLALVPSGYEVYLSATNVQWTCPLLALLICLSEDVPARSLSGVLRCAMLGVCGLTGLPSCILGPLFLLGAWRRRSAFGWSMLGVIAAASAVQAAVLLWHRGDVAGRAFDVSPLVLVPLSMQGGLALFLPVKFLDHGVSGLSTGAARVQIALAGLALLAGVTALAADRLGRVPALALAGAAVLSSVLNEVGALERVDDMVSGGRGGRYFFLAQCCVVLMLAVGLAARDNLPRIAAGIMAALVLAGGVLEVGARDWSTPFTAGPSLAERVDACPPEGPCRVRAWPIGPKIWVTIRGDEASD